jgi:hypothetical protein
MQMIPAFFFKIFCCGLSLAKVRKIVILCFSANLMLYFLDLPCGKIVQYMQGIRPERD